MTTDSDHTAQNRETYDRIAPLYVARQLEYQASGDDLFRTLEERWIACLPGEGRVSDLGCGPAIAGARFAAAGHQVVGIDFSLGMLSTATPRLPGQLAQADLRALPLRGGALDGAWCVAALLHLPEVETKHVLEQIRTALRQGGVLALVTALGEGAHFEPVPYAPQESRWFVYRRRARLERQIQSAGYQIIFSTQVERARHWLTTLARAI